MSVAISASENITSIQFKNQSADPATPAAGYSQVFTKSDGLYVKNAAGAVTGPLGAGGGGGLAHSYIGKNAVGASNETIARRNAVVKKVTLASDGFLASIGAYIEGSGAAVGLVGLVLDDNSGAPGKLRAIAPSGNGAFLIDASTWRWVEMPMGVYVSAGSYWIGFLYISNSSINPLPIAYDTGGHDYSGTVGATDTYMETSIIYSDTTKDYSIRASVLS